MCRANCDGGRRCPSNRGERKRAYQRARYAARAVAAERSKSFSAPATAPPEVAALASMTRAERAEVRDAARERVAAGTVKARAALDNVAHDLSRPEDVQKEIDQMQALIASSDLTDEEREKAQRRIERDIRRLREMTPDELFANRNNYMLGTYETRDAYTTAVIELGGDMTLAAEATYLDRAEEAGLTDDLLHGTAIAAAEQNPQYRAARLRADRQAEADALMREMTPAFAADDTDQAILLRLRSERRDNVPFEQSEVSPEMLERYLETLAPEHYAQAKAEGRLAATDPDDRVSLVIDALESYDSPSYCGPDYYVQQEIRDLQQRRHEMWSQANRDEVARVQSLGGQEWVPATTNTITTKAHRDQLAEAVAVFPDDMVAEARERLPELHFRYTKTRAHFSEQASVQVSVKRDQYVAIDNLGEMGTDPFFDGSIRYYYDSQGQGVPPTPENRERVAEIVRMHNAGETYGRATRRDGRGTRQLVMVEETDDNGDTWLHVRFKNGTTEKRHLIRPEITTSGSFSTTVHEVAHAMELSPQVSMACNHFLAKRTKDLERSVYHKSKKHGTEYTRGDGFAREYVGKEYPGPHTEVFSMGIEGLFAAHAGGMRGLGGPRLVRSRDKGEFTFIDDDTTDTEHRNLIMGIMAAYRPMSGEVK